MRATEYAPSGPFYLPERCHGLAEILERGAVVLVPAGPISSRRRVDASLPIPT